jgi:ribosomal protein S24E
MKITIEKQVENPLLNRKEIEAVATDVVKTPSREEMWKTVSHSPTK